MIDEFVKAWDANKENLKNYIASNIQEKYDSYYKIVKILFEKVINPYLLDHIKTIYNIERIHEIDDGEYQGTLLYIIPLDTYQPSRFDYIITDVDYGSCSGCDTLLSISNYDTSKLPDEDQVENYLTLFLHILQHCKPLYEL